MYIFAYQGLDSSMLSLKPIDCNGNEYKPLFRAEISVDMEYRGREGVSVNSQGWERNQHYYFSRLLESKPECFGTHNRKRIENGKAPIVDKVWISNFPEYENYLGDKLIHHHIGGDGQVVAVPSLLHMGSGGIHNDEKRLKITAEAKRFSEECEKLKEEGFIEYGMQASECRKIIQEYKRAKNKGKSKSDQVIGSKSIWGKAGRIAVKGLKLAAGLVVATAASKVGLGGIFGGNNNEGGYSSVDRDYTDNVVSGHKQRYHTNEGTIWKDKDSYLRTSKK